MKPFIAVFWVLSIAVAIGLTRIAGPDQGGSVPSPSLDEAFGEMDPLRRAYLISRALQDLGPDDLPEMKSVFETRKTGFMAEEVRLLMLVWARFDGPGAYAWASEWPDGWKKTLTGESFWAWGYHDGPAAIRFAEEIEDPELMARSRQNAIAGWMRSDDKEGVTEYIANYEEMGPRGRLTFILAGEIAMARGMDGAMRWVEDLPEEGTHNDLKRIEFNHIAKMVAGEDDPVRAAEWFLKHRTRPYSKGALDGITRRWVQGHDRPSAFEWLLKMSDDGDGAGQRDDAIAAGFRSWMQIDPDAAQAWLLPKLPNPALDPAILEASKRLTPRETRTAIEWAQRLDDELARHQELVRVGLRWSANDPAAFDEWLKESDLSEETRQTILRRSPRLRRAQGVNMSGNPNPAAARKP